MAAVQASAEDRAPANSLFTEHLQYTPLSLIDDIINTVNTIVYRAVDAVESGLLNTPPSALGFSETTQTTQTDSGTSSHDHDRGKGGDGDDEDMSKDRSPDASSAEGNQRSIEDIARAEIEHGVHQLETLLGATVDTTFDKFELYALRNFFSLPAGLEPWVRLQHYENLELPLPTQNPSPESIALLRTRLQAARKRQIALASEHATVTALMTRVRTFTGSATTPNTSNSPATDPSSALACLISRSAASKPTTSLSTHAEFATSQLPTIRSLLAELRPARARLAAYAATTAEASMDPGALDAMDIDADPTREARNAYVEDVARRVVNQQVGMSSQAGTDVGSSQDPIANLVGAQPKVSADEVEALESLVRSGALRQDQPRSP